MDRLRRGCIRLWRVVLMLMIIIMMVGVSYSMEPRFYDSTCPGAEALIYNHVSQRHSLDKTIAPALIQLHYRDCIATGCDGSILLNSSPQGKAEKYAAPNSNLRGFDLIDEIKDQLELKCPLVVTCADILAIAARDAVTLSGGPWYDLLLGRHDVMSSRESDAYLLPDIASNLTQALAIFHNKGFTTQEVVALLGSHAIGSAQCSYFEDRLYNYKGTGKADPTMNTSLLWSLKGQCSQATIQNKVKVALDQSKVVGFHIGINYYKSILNGLGVLAMEDQLRHQDTGSLPFVTTFSHRTQMFTAYFAHSMKKLSMVGTLSHSGETRRKCYEINKL